MGPTNSLSLSISINLLYLIISSFLSIEPKKKRHFSRALGEGPPQPPQPPPPLITIELLGFEDGRLSVVLESSISSTTSSCSNTSSQVLNKTSMINKSSTPNSPTPSSPNGFSRRGSSLGFLEHCFLCKENLLPGKDIYMYKGDRGFCSEECRWRQMLMDEEKSKTEKPKTKSRDNNCSLVATNPQLGSPSSSRSQKGGSKRSNGFVY